VLSGRIAGSGIGGAAAREVAALSGQGAARDDTARIGTRAWQIAAVQSTGSLPDPEAEGEGGGGVAPCGAPGAANASSAGSGPAALQLLPCPPVPPRTPPSSPSQLPRAPPPPTQPAPSWQAALSRATGDDADAQPAVLLRGVRAAAAAAAAAARSA
jgi:hypothetical protein